MAFTYPITILNSNINVTQTTNPTPNDVKTYDLSSQLPAANNTFSLESIPVKDTFEVILDGLTLAFEKDYSWVNDYSFIIFNGDPQITNTSTLLVKYRID